ncbi:MAG: cytochrome c [Hyphomicrobiaceae bacterium]|nr:cytochrome c [Hyphomicrobiaceae bacterium]
MLSGLVFSLLALLGGATLAQKGDDIARGEYLARIMDCAGCHTPGALIGKPDQARNLAGSEIGFHIPDLGYFYPPNLTSDGRTGLGTWTEADIIKAVRTGVRPDGRILAPVMPWHSYAALNDADAQMLARYLKSLPPVPHEVPGPTGASGQPPAPYLTVVAPKR